MATTLQRRLPAASYLPRCARVGQKQPFPASWQPKPHTSTVIGTSFLDYRAIPTCQIFQKSRFTIKRPYRAAPPAAFSAASSRADISFGTKEYRESTARGPGSDINSSFGWARDDWHVASIGSAACERQHAHVPKSQDLMQYNAALKSDILADNRHSGTNKSRDTCSHDTRRKIHRPRLRFVPHERSNLVRGMSASRFLFRTKPFDRFLPDRAWTRPDESTTDVSHRRLHTYSTSVVLYITIVHVGWR